MKVKVIIFILALFTVSPAFAEILASGNDVRMIPPPAMPSATMAPAKNVDYATTAELRATNKKLDELSKIIKGTKNEPGGLAAEVKGFQTKIDGVNGRVDAVNTRINETNTTLNSWTDYIQKGFNRLFAFEERANKKIDTKCRESYNMAVDAYNMGVCVIIGVIVICVLFALWGLRGENRYSKRP